VAKVVQGVDGLNVSVLVNNVGVNTEFPAELVQHTEEEIDSIIRVNCSFTTKLTRAFIPKLSAVVASKTVARRGLLINLGSVSSLLPTALMPVYAASKAYDDALSYALSAELAAQKIDVMSGASE
jgi:short-subunit dehydrogenase